VYHTKTRIQGDCAPFVSENKSCDPYPETCYQTCEFGDWTDWGDCDPKVGWGWQYRTRPISQHPTGPEICPPNEDKQICYNAPPPVQCIFSDWSPWGDCDATCKAVDGTPVKQYRERWLLSSPTSTNNDTANSETLTEDDCIDHGLYGSQDCNVAYCPIDCVMTKWSEWSDCQWPGIRIRTRSVKNQPQFNGAPCPACTEETDRCTMRENDNLPGICEVGPCLLEVQKEWEAKSEGVPVDQIVV
jgi:hypothetical protein